MKIQNEAIKALLQQGDAPQKTQSGQAAQTGFENLLAAQLQNSAALNPSVPGTEGLAGPQTDQSVTSLALLMQSTNAASATEGMPDENAEAANRIGSLLDQWEQYAQALSGTESGDLRGLFGMLQGMTQGVKDLKSSASGLLASDPALASMINELDVMTTTETIKFNRGDYL